MTNRKTNQGLGLLFGLTFISPITYSVLAYEMDVVQRVFYFSISLLLFFVYILKSKFEKGVILNKYLTILILLFPFSFLTAFFNDSASLLILKFSDLLIPLAIIIQSTIMFLILGEDKFFKIVSYSVVIFSTLFSIIGLLESFQIKLMDLPAVMPPGSLLGHRGFASEYLSSALPFFLIANEYINLKNRKVLLIAAILNVSFLLFTRSRAGILILFFVIIVYFIFIFLKTPKKEILKKIKPILVVISVSLLLSFIPLKVGERPDLKSTAETFFDQEFKSNMLRLNFWDASVKMIMEKPLVGHGLYKWSGYYPKYYGDYFDDKSLLLVHNIHAHNDFLEMFAESGLLAPVIYLLIFISVLAALFKKIKQNEKYFALILVVIIIFCFSVVSFPTYKFASFFHLAVVCGIALAAPAISEKNTFRLNAKYLKVILFILLIVGGIISYIKLKSELGYSQAIYLKDRRQYQLMSQKLDEVSDVFYPFDAAKQPVDYYRGIANSYLSRHSEALQNNLAGLELAPFNPILMRNAAASYQETGDKKRAIEQFEKVKKYFPNYLGSQFKLLKLYLDAGQTEKAEKLYLELNEKSPGNPELNAFQNQFNKHSVR
ncbi:MAG: O-antigen ligase C-terminal domain-containing protein [bacterium]|nr:O-antigen ligase C-terminal domain-containing protein [bacterium]